MRVLIFDTETTGLWQFKRPFDHPSQPEIVQIAAKLVEDSTARVLGQVNYIVRPDNPCSEEAANVHGISQDIIDVAGVPRRTALSGFHHLLKLSERVVAHNYNFDSKVVARSYLLEDSQPALFNSIPYFCTMLESTPVLKLPGRYGKYKWPSLQEAYRMLVDPSGFDGAHDAMVDVDACLQVYLALRGMENGHNSKIPA